MRYYKFWLNSNHIVQGKYIAAARSNDGEFIDLDSHSVAYEPCLLVVSHKIAFKVSLLYHIHCYFVEQRRSDARPTLLFKTVANIDGTLMGATCKVVKLGQRVYTGHIGHITSKITVGIDHHAHPGFDYSAVGTYRKRRIQPSAPHRKIVRGGHIGIISGKNIGHK